MNLRIKRSDWGAQGTSNDLISQWRNVEREEDITLLILKYSPRRKKPSNGRELIIPSNDLEWSADRRVACLQPFNLLKSSHVTVDHYSTYGMKLKLSKLIYGND